MVIEMHDLQTSNGSLQVLWVRVSQTPVLTNQGSVGVVVTSSQVTEELEEHQTIAGTQLQIYR